MLNLIDNLKNNKKAMDFFITTLHSAAKPSLKPLHPPPVFNSRNDSSLLRGGLRSTLRHASELSTSPVPDEPLSKRLQPKEYFMKYIRPEHKQLLQRQDQRFNSYIAYDRRDKQSFKQKVRDYMDLIDREESQLSIRLSDAPDAVQNSELRLETESLPPIASKKGKATFLKAGGKQVLYEAPQKLVSLSAKKKELPRYMQANLAWLSKDKHLSSEMAQSMRETSLNAKSKGSSMFPALTQQFLKKTKKGETGNDIYIEENLQIQKAAKEAQKKFFEVNREDPLVVDLFKKMCQEKRDSNIVRARLTKGKMKAHLSRKYKGRVAEKILEHLDLSVPLDFGQYLDMLEKLMNFGQDKLKRVAFNVYNYNGDRYVCQLDLYSIMKLYEGDDQVFVAAYSYDICKLIAFLDQKKAQKGN